MIRMHFPSFQATFTPASVNLSLFFDLHFNVLEPNGTSVPVFVLNSTTFADATCTVNMSASGVGTVYFQVGSFTCSNVVTRLLFMISSIYTLYTVIFSVAALEKSLVLKCQIRWLFSLHRVFCSLVDAISCT